MLQADESETRPGGVKFFTIPELALMLEVDIRELRELERSGRLASFFFEGERHYSLEQVREVMARTDDKETS